MNNINDISRILENIENGNYSLWGKLYLDFGDKFIWAMIVIGLILGILIGIYFGQWISIHMNQKEFNRLKLENEKMHYELIEYKAVEKLQQAQRQEN